MFESLEGANPALGVLAGRDDFVHFGHKAGPDDAAGGVVFAQIIRCAQQGGGLGVDGLLDKLQHVVAGVDLGQGVGGCVVRKKFVAGCRRWLVQSFGDGGQLPQGIT